MNEFDKNKKIDTSSWTSIFKNIDPNYYVQELSKTKRIVIRILYVILYFSAIILFILAAVKLSTVFEVWHIVLFQALSIGLMIWLFVIFLNYMTAGYEISGEDYNKTSFALKRSTFGASFCMAAATIDTAVFMILNHLIGIDNLIWCVVYLLSTLCILTIHLIERNIKYSVIPNPMYDSDRTI